MVSLAPFVLRRPWLTKMLMPAATWYANAAGYRKLGLRYELFIFLARTRIPRLPEKRRISDADKRRDKRNRIEAVDALRTWGQLVNW